MSVVTSHSADAFNLGVSPSAMRAARSLLAPWPMKPLGILYATREGHTFRVAEHVAASLRRRGHEADLIDVASVPLRLDLASYDAVLLAASVHIDHHPREMTDFVTHHRDELEKILCAFISVSLLEARAEDPGASEDVRQKAAQEVRAAIADFLERTDWHPDYVMPVAGALPGPHYGEMSLMAKGASQLRSDCETCVADQAYTDWYDLERFVGEMATEIEARSNRTG
jgi:menaquinone-dependent protoporphyrinogen oxidase